MKTSIHQNQFVLHYYFRRIVKFQTDASSRVDHIYLKKHFKILYNGSNSKLNLNLFYDSTYKYHVKPDIKNQ